MRTCWMRTCWMRKCWMRKCWMRKCWMRKCWLGSLPQSRLESFRRCCADRTAQRPSPRARRRYQIGGWPAASLFQIKLRFVLKDVRDFRRFHGSKIGSLGLEKAQRGIRTPVKRYPRRTPQPPMLTTTLSGPRVQPTPVLRGLKWFTSF